MLLSAVSMPKDKETKQSGGYPSALWNAAAGISAATILYCVSFLLPFVLSPREEVFLN